LKRIPEAVDTEAQAAQWLIRLEANRSPYTVRPWQRWLSADTRRRAVFVRLESSWRQANALRSLRPLDGRIDLDILDTFPGLQSHSAGRPWWSRLWSARHSLTVALAAAAVASVATLGGWLVVTAPDRATHRTERGGFERVVLPDGSTALLNTNTEMRLRFTRERREILFTRGEALFTVARDERRPFEVAVGNDTIRALGTSFDVRLREPRELEVMVTQGTVAIDRALFPRSVLAAGDDVLVSALHPAQVLHTRKSAIERRLAWTHGQIWLDQATLAEAVAEFNRYNSRQLVIAEPRLAKLRVGGTFTTTDPTAFLAALERIFGIQARDRANQLILTGSPTGDVGRPLGPGPR
jgi:transmembrane sensor